MSYEVIYDPDSQEHMFFVQDNMMLCKNLHYDRYGDEGRGDAISRTERARRTYKDPRFEKGIRSCWERKEGGPHGHFLFGWRYPHYYDRMDMSRDHLSTTLQMISKTRPTFSVWLFYHQIPWRFSFSKRAGKKTIDFHLWALSLCGKVWAEILYYLWSIPEMIVTILWSKLWKLILGVRREVTQEEYMNRKHEFLAVNRRKQKWLKLIPPVYGLYGRAEQLDCMPRSFGRFLMKKLLLLETPRQNHVMRLLLGAKVTKEQVEQYRSQRGGRWSGSFTIMNDRDFEYNESTANRLDKDYLWVLYHERYPRS